MICYLVFLFGLIGIASSANASGLNMDIEEKIVYFAEKQGVDPQLALAIAQCESGLTPSAKNRHSSASGVFQFIKGTWKDTTKRLGWHGEVDVFDGHLNVIAGIYVLREDGTRPWESSRSCWEPKLSANLSAVL